LFITKLYTATSFSFLLQVLLELSLRRWGRVRRLLVASCLCETVFSLLKLNTASVSLMEMLTIRMSISVME